MDEISTFICFALSSGMKPYIDIAEKTKARG